jgi:hypothetical protein
MGQVQQPVVTFQGPTVPGEFFCQSGGRIMFRSEAYMYVATPICFRLARQDAWFAFCLAICSAGSRRLARMAMIAMTTSSSISVNGTTFSIRALATILSIS